jgi:hypothetical protein
MRGVLIVILIFSITAFSAGCSDGSDRPDRTASQFSYSVLTSDSGRGIDLLEEFDSSAWPKLRKAGAQKYGIWSNEPGSSDLFEEIADDKLVVMLRWKKIKIERLAEELGAMTGVSEVTTSLWEVSLRAEEGPIETGTGFYIHRFNRYLSEDVDEVLSLSEQAWVTWEPFWGAEVVGVWSDLDEVDAANGITRQMRIAWYRDMEHWQETREFWREPDSFELFIERAALELDNEAWSGNLQPH